MGASRARKRSAIRGAGAAFTLFEVVVALSVFAFGIVAVLALYNNNLRAARQAKEELALSMIRREIQARTQLAAFNAADARGECTFAGSDWLLRDTDVPDDPGAPEPLDGPNPRPPASDEASLNAQRWEQIKARFDAVTPGANWDRNALCAGFQFRMRAVWPSEAENNQFTDVDGYDVWDGKSRRLLANIYSDEVQGADPPPALPGHNPVRPPASAHATPVAGTKNEGYFGPPRPSHGAVYDPRGMRWYLKRIKCVIGWDLARSGDIFSGQRDIFYFTVYNPDARKSGP